MFRVAAANISNSTLHTSPDSVSAFVDGRRFYALPKPKVTFTYSILDFTLLVRASYFGSRHF